MHSSDGSAGSGYLYVVLRNAAGEVIQEQTVQNMITTYGDEYYTTKVAIGIGSFAGTIANVNGMKLGTSSTAATKSGAASYIGGSYIAGSNMPIDSSFPTIAAASGVDQGWEICYQSTWPAGAGTSTSINEVEICTDRTTDNGHANNRSTISRAVLTTINKGASDSLTIMWYHKYLGKTTV